MFVVLSHLILGSFGEQQWTTDAKAFPLLSPTRMAPGSSGSSVLAVTRLVLWPSVPLLRAVLGQGQNLAHRVFQDVSRCHLSTLGHLSRMEGDGPAPSWEVEGTM